MTDYKFEGWMGLDAESAKGNMVWQEYEPKPWEETDVDIKITNSGICGSDLHTLRSGWVSTESRVLTVENTLGRMFKRLCRGGFCLSNRSNINC